MLADTPDQRPTGRIEIRSPAGTRFMISNAQGGLSTSGVGNASLELPQGLYEVTWTSGSSRQSKIVRVVAKSKPVVAEFKAPELSIGMESSMSNEEAGLEKFRSELPSKRDYGSAVAIIVQGGLQRDGTRSKFDMTPSVKGIRLYNAKSRPMRADHERGVSEDLVEGGHSRFYAVRPGDYILSFPDSSGVTMQQTIPALPDRTTIVFLQAKQGHILLTSKDKFQRHESQGIRVDQTIILSIDEDDEAHRIRERARLARVLLNDLAGCRTSIDREFRNILGDPRTDPLLRLMGAAVAVNRLKSGLRPFPADKEPEDDTEREATARLGWQSAYNWLRFDKGVRLSSDETAVKWQLAALDLGSIKVRHARSIESPPMLSQCWRWAIEHSARHPASLLPSMANVAAVRSINEFGPWLCWKASASKAAPAPQVDDGQKIDDLAVSVREKAEKLSNLKVKKAGANDKAWWSDSRNENGGQESSLNLPSNSQIAMGEFSASSARLVKGAFSLVDNTAEPIDLATSLGLPGDALPRRLHQVGEELDSLIEVYEHEEDSEEANPVPPAMYEPILHPDDLNLGRFGEQAQVDGYTLSASFEATKSRKWTKIVLKVRGPAKDGTLVEFFLHDSFHQPERSAFVENGEARVGVNAWGGFTVGVWIPHALVQLELNLAKVPGAPPNIRTL